MHNISIEEFTQVKQEVLQLRSKVDKLIAAIPAYVSLVDVAEDLNISRQALRKYIYENFRASTDFKLKNNKIVLNVGILSVLREHYAR